MNYLNIPILAKFYLIEEKLSIDLGPQFGFNLNGKRRVKRDKTTILTNVSDQIKTFDFAVVMGASYRLTELLDVQARYNLGLTEVWRNAEGRKSRNGVLQIGVAYRF